MGSRVTLVSKLKRVLQMVHFSAMPQKVVLKVAATSHCLEDLIYHRGCLCKHSPKLKILLSKRLILHFLHTSLTALHHDLGICPYKNL